MACEDPDLSFIRFLGGVALHGAGVDVIGPYQDHLREQIALKAPPSLPANASTVARSCLEEIKKADRAVRRAGATATLDGTELRAAERALARAKAARLTLAELDVLAHRVESIRRKIRSSANGISSYGWASKDDTNVGAAVPGYTSDNMESSIGRRAVAYTALFGQDPDYQKKSLARADAVLKEAGFDRAAGRLPEKPHIEDEELRQIIDSGVWKPQKNHEKGGSGSTADAVRIEQLSHRPVQFDQGQQKWHGDAALNRMNRLAKLARKPSLSTNDRSAVLALLADLRDSLSWLE